MEAQKDELLTSTEVAKILKVHVQTLAKWRMTGKGPDFVILEKRAVRYRQSVINKYIDSNQWEP